MKTGLSVASILLEALTKCRIKLTLRHAQGINRFYQTQACPNIRKHKDNQREGGATK